MQTVNFQCGHCGKLMAVTENLLGQQVRCPHCQQVVVAPPPVAAPPPPFPPPAPLVPEQPVFTAPLPPAEHESIFTPPEEGDEDLFGAGSRPQVELPPAPVWEPPPAPPPVPPLVESPPAPPPVPPSLGLPPIEPTVTYLPRDQATAPDTHMTGARVDGDIASLPPTDLMPPAPVAEDGPPSGPPPSGIVAPPSAVRAAPRGGGWLLPVLGIYSVMATLCMIAMVAVAMMARQQQDDILDRLPDDGDYRGASHSQQKSGPKRLDFKTIPLHRLPDRLRVPVGSSIRVGDLKLSPTKVELRRIKTQSGNYNPDERTDDSLVLWLDLENVSRDVVFRPMDPFFDRKWHGGFESNTPFTYVEMGNQRFYGGPCDWPPGKDNSPEKVIGQNYDRVLSPGEKMETFVCTNPDNHVGAALAGYRGQVVYRVRFRRGLVPLLHGGEASATAVIGVVFSPQDVSRPEASS
jgi:hypothetical protein